MKHRTDKIFSLIVLLFLGVSIAYAQNPQETLKQYVSELQKNPGDNALREKIIRHVQEMKPVPSIPEEARRHYVMAKTLFDSAKKVEDFSDSIAEFRSALLVAPWWAEANRDLGLALEAAQRHDEAIAYVKLYMATNPGDDRTRAAQDEIYKIEAKKKLTAKEKSETVAKATADARDRAESEAKAKLDSVEGTWQATLYVNGPRTEFYMKISKGRNGEWTIDFPPGYEKLYAYDIKQGGRTISFTRMSRGADPELNTDYYVLTLSADGTKLAGTLRSISIAGNRPHWETEEREFFRK